MYVIAIGILRLSLHSSTWTYFAPTEVIFTLVHWDETSTSYYLHMETSLVYPILILNYICGFSISPWPSKMITKEVSKRNKKETQAYIYALSSTMGCIDLRDHNTYHPKIAKMMLYPILAIGVDFFVVISIFCLINFAQYSISCKFCRFLGV